MKNIVEEKPTDEIHGRTLYCTRFVNDEDIINKNILDIGCGFGWMELELSRRGAKHITGVEISQKDLETAQKYIRDEKIDLSVSPAVSLPFGNEIFDAVVSWDVIEHIPKNKENEMFKEIRRVLKPGGVFYISTPYKSFFSNLFDPAWWLIGHRHYSKNQISSFATTNGFDIEKIVVNGGWWEIIGINNLYIAKWIFRRKPFFQNFINKKQDKEYKKEKGFAEIFMKFKRHG